MRARIASISTMRLLVTLDKLFSCQRRSSRSAASRWRAGTEHTRACELAGGSNAIDVSALASAGDRDNRRRLTVRARELQQPHDAEDQHTVEGFFG